TGYYLPEEGPSTAKKVSVKTVDYYYMDTYELKLVAGRWFYENEGLRAADTTIAASERYTYVVNEAAARQLGFTNPEEILGKRITMGLAEDATAPVVGVVA